MYLYREGAWLSVDRIEEIVWLSGDRRLRRSSTYFAFSDLQLKRVPACEDRRKQQAVQQPVHVQIATP